jgi:superoxide dismutase, Cu-Zn family
MMDRTGSALGFFLLALVLTGCSSAILTRIPVASASATLTTANGTAAGTVQLRQAAGGVVTVEVNATGLTPGAHGIHFHEVGQCEGSSAFSTAGAHYNPLNKEHGLERPNGPHAGDAPNLVANSSGTATLSFTTDRVTLTSGSVSLLDANGSSVVIHAAADDQVSQPSGNSGGRVACGVIQLNP